MPNTDWRFLRCIPSMLLLKAPTKIKQLHKTIYLHGKPNLVNVSTWFVDKSTFTHPLPRRRRKYCPLWWRCRKNSMFTRLLTWLIRQKIASDFPNQRSLWLQFSRSNFRFATLAVGPPKFPKSFSMAVAQRNAQAFRGQTNLHFSCRRINNGALSDDVEWSEAETKHYHLIGIANNNHFLCYFFLLEIGNVFCDCMRAQ